MGIISIEKAQKLYWLGRYIERAMTSMQEFFVLHDDMLDKDITKYTVFCEKLGIPNIYSDSADFHHKYVYSLEDPFSIRNSIERAYDNAIVLRSEIGSDTLTHLEVALNIISKHNDNGPRSNYFAEEAIVDNLLAFWGCADDVIVSEESRSIMKAGKYIERLDLFMRFERSISEIQIELQKLKVRMSRLKMSYDTEAFEKLVSIYEKGEGWEENKAEAFECLVKLFPQL